MQRDDGRDARGNTSPARSQRTKNSEADQPAGEQANEAKSPGRVVFDSRGNSVWRWENEQDESTSILLKRLENDELALEPTRPVPILGKKTSNQKSTASGQGSDRKLTIENRDKGGGFDPYNRS